MYEAVAFREGGGERPLLVKRFLEEYVNPETDDEVVAELRILPRLFHPNVVQIFDFGVAGGRYFLAQELVRGCELGKLLARASEKSVRLPQALAVFIAGEIAKGLDEAHRLYDEAGLPAHILHRGLTPGNVILGVDGSVKLDELGLAPLNARAALGRLASRAKRWMSPEQADGRPLDARSDLFTLGSILYQMLTGTYAFDGRSDKEILDAVRKAAPRPAASWPGVPKELSTITTRLLARNPADRYASGSEVAAELEQWATSSRAAIGASVRLASLVSQLVPELAQAHAEDAERARAAARAELAITLIVRKSDAQGRPVFEAKQSDEGASSERPLNAASVIAGTDVVSGRYLLREILGRGGMGIVYRANDLVLHDEIALKLLQPQSAHDPTGISRFKGEIIAARRISHPNVIRIHDFGMSGGDAFVAMELLSGGSLADRVKKGAIPIGEGAAMLGAICDGLAAAHEAGIVHRDLKPENVLFDGAGAPKIVDFGLARLLAASDRSVSFAGTPFYMSPEQATGEPIGVHSDIYSLGVVAYEVFTGKLPFVADSIVQLAMMHTQNAPPPLREMRPELPARVEAIVMQMLEKHPEARYNSAAQIASDIRAAVPEARLIGDRIARASAEALAHPSPAPAPADVASPAPEREISRAARDPDDESGTAPMVRRKPATAPQAHATELAVKRARRSGIVTLLLAVGALVALALVIVAGSRMCGPVPTPTPTPTPRTASTPSPANSATPAPAATSTVATPAPATPAATPRPSSRAPRATPRTTPRR